MKNIFIAFTAILFSGTLLAQTNNWNSDKLNKRDVVKRFAQEMVNSKVEGNLENYIAPSIVKANNFSDDKHLINKYSPKGFEIKSEKGNTVICNIWGSNKSWEHELTFKMMQENGTWYFTPVYDPESSTQYIDLWVSVRSYINEASNDDKKKVVQNFLQEMVDGKVSKDLTEYVSSSTRSALGIVNGKHKVNTYAPDGFKIKSGYGNIVRAEIWGNDRSWVHELSFELEKVGGKYYFKSTAPSDYDYINLWYKADTYINKEKEDEVDTWKKSYKDKADISLVNKNARTKKVDLLLSQMVNRTVSDELTKYISKKDFDKHNLVAGKHAINTYSPKGYTLASDDEKTGTVTAYIWGEDKKWVHKLTFKLFKQGKDYCFEVNRVSKYDYVTIWSNADANLDIDPATLK